MVRARCPDCDELVVITPTGRKQAESGSAQWWQIVAHFFRGSPCRGSHKLV